MNQNPSSFAAMVRQPSALLPLAMSLAALALVLGRVAIYGVAREADEGAVAHLWQLLMAGQLPVYLGELRYVGRIGTDFSIEEGQAAARQCGVNLIAQVADALNGDLDRVVRCLKLGGFVNATPEFRDHPKVINGASELMIQVFGDIGRHARFAVGVNSLPFGVSVEIDGIFQVR